MKRTIWVLVVVLIVLHHDFWFWTNSDLVAGFIPVGMAYHLGISIAAAVLWYLATVFAWPEDAEPDAKTEATD